VSHPTSSYIHYLPKARAKIVGVSFGDVDPFSFEAVEFYEKALRDAQEQGTRVKVLLLCNPHNPLGQETQPYNKNIL
jgi:histidinol-phosphate/aromatic aminotransferase/cobyric acid decarboxylase-like protein